MEVLVYNITNDSAPKAGGCTTDGVADNGLVLNLDAGTTVSYPGSNTTWYDLNSNGNHVTLTNGPTYDGANNGSIVFDGSNDYANFYAPNITIVATVEIWAKLSSNYTEKIMFGWNSYDIYTGGNNIGYNTSNGDLYGFSAATATALGVANNWKHYVFEMHSDVSYTNYKIYVNGILQTLSQIYATEVVGSRTFNGDKGRVASWRSTASYYMPMSLGVFRVYNRALTQSEVTQNFNALRSRYGI